MITDDNTNSSVEAVETLESVETNSPNSLDEAAKFLARNESDDESLDIEPESKEVAEVKEKREPDDFDLAEGIEETEPQNEDVKEAVLATEDMLLEVEGEKIPLSELKKSRLLEADYTRSKQAVAQERSQLQELGQNFSSALERISEFLYSKIPAEPDPQLTYTNPNLHYQQKVMHDAAMAEVMQILQVQKGATEAVGGLNDAQLNSLMSESDATVIQQMPHLKDPNRLNAFNRTVLQAAKALGYSEADVKQGSTDPRMRMLVFKAAGYDKMKADAAKAKAKVQQAKPMLAVRSQNPNSIAAQSSQNAKSRLISSGSIDDAAAYLASLENG